MSWIVSALVLDLHVAGLLPQSGFIRQEDIPLKAFLDNRFGRIFAKPETSVPHERLFEAPVF